MTQAALHNYPPPWTVERIASGSGMYCIRDARGREVGYCRNEAIALEFARWRNTAPRLIDAAREILDLTDRLRVSLESDAQT